MAVHALASSTWSIQLENTSYAGRLLAGGFLTSAGAVATRDGVLVGYSDGAVAPVDLKVVPDVNMWLKFYSGRAAVTRPGQGVYLHTFDSAVLNSIQLDAADSTNARIDLVICRNYDPVTIGSDPQPRGRVEVVTGVPGAVPVAPYNLIPAAAGYTPLAEVTVPANASAITLGNIVDKRRGTTGRGGIRVLLPGDSLADAGTYVGELIDSGGTIYRWNVAGGVGVWGVLAYAGPPKFARANLLRSDGSSILNAGDTDLKLYSAAVYGGAWSTTYNGRGFSLAQSGLYEVTTTLHTAVSGNHYIGVTMICDSPVYSNVIAGDSATDGFSTASGTDHVFVPVGGSFNCYFRAYNSAAAGFVNYGGATSYASVRKVGEAQ